VDGLRKAALALSGLRDADRDWILARLPSGTQSGIAPLLEELRAMRIRLEPEDVAQLLEAPRKDAETVRAVPTLELASPRMVLEVLEAESDWLVAVVLRARAWPWRAGFLELLDAERRKRVRATLRQALPERPKVLNAALAAIEERLRSMAAELWEAPAWRS